MNGYVYVLGGYDGEFQLNVCERMSLDTDEWNFVKSMHIAREATSACTVNEQYI